MPAITGRILAIVLLATSAFSGALAKDEHRDVIWSWRLYGVSSGDFPTAQAVIDAFNARSEQLYATCSSGTCNGTCTKVAHTPPINPGPGTAKINGQWTWLMTSGATFTTYHTACGANPPSGPTSTFQNGAIAASAVLQCPTGWSGMGYNSHYETLNGVQHIVYDMDCVRFVPDCPDGCNRPGPPLLYGNPIDAVGNSKMEMVTDYASADGLLRISREYSSQAGQWSWNHHIALTDFTGRSAVRHASVALKASVKLVPEGIYYPPAIAPAAVDTPRAFHLIKSPAAGTPPQVWVSGARGTRIVFNENAGAFATTALNKPQLSLIPGPGGTQRWLLRDRKGRFDLFDVDGNLLQQAHADGKSLTYARTATTLTVTASPGGRQLAYSRSSSNLVDGAYDIVTLPDNAQLQYAINGAALVTAVTYADTTSRSYLYDEAAHSGLTATDSPANRLTGLMDENQVRSATYKYDWYGPISTELAGGVNKFTFNPNFGGFNGARQIQRPPNNATETVNWDSGPDGERRVTSRWLPAGAGSSASTKSVSYDSNGLVASVTDDRGNRTCYANDSARGVETVRLEGVASGVSCPATLATHSIPANTRQRKISTQWHPDWNLPITRAEPKRITTWVFNGQPDPLAGGTASCAPSTALLPDGSPIAVLCKRVEQATTDDTGSAAFSATSSGTPRTWAYTYNEFGQVLTADGPRTDTDVTTYTYYTCSTGYQCGQLATVTNAAGHATSYDTYNAHGQPLTITDPNSVVTTLTYDLRQRLTSRTVGSEQTTFAYWPTGLLKKTTLPDGSFLEYTYDAAHRLTGVNDDAGNRIAYTLDAAGNRTKEEAFDPFNALASTRGRAFDALSRISQEIGAAGTAAVTTSLLYDNNGNTRGVNAPLDRNTVNTYDELDRLTQVTDPASGLTKYGYDGLDQLISVTDPRNKITSYTYNGLGDLTQQVSPDTGTTTNTYDSGGNLGTSTDARSKTATYAYDALNRVTSVTYPDQTISYTYDSGTNQNGRLTQVSDASGSTSWSYDTHGRVLSKQQSMGVTKTVGYDYDSAGRLQTLTLPSGNTVSYDYTDGKITSLTLNGATTILSNVLYQPFGPTQGWTWGNSTLAVREYDADGKITDIDSAGLKTYGYDDAFRITSISDAVDPSLGATYWYDVADRLNQYAPGPVAAPTVSPSATSVVAGGSLSVTVSGVPASATYWVALASTSASSGTYSKWSTVTPTGGSYVWNLSAPDFPGTYEARLFAPGFDRLATSVPVAVTAATPPAQPALATSAGTTAPGATATVRLTSGPGGATDWLALAQVGTPNTSYLQWTYVGSGVTSRDWTITMPATPGNYEFRLFLNGGFTIAATSPPVTLTSAPPVAPGPSTYTYDLNGNRLTGEGSTHTISSTSNRVTSVSGALSRTYSYDNSGNTTSDGTAIFTYNDAGRMVSATNAGVSAAYALNALGQRVKKTTSGSSRYFAYDEAGHLVGEYDNSGNLIQETVWLGDIPVATLRPNGAGVNLFYIHTDHLNAPRRISRPSDNVIVWRWDSDPFGTTAANEDPDGDSNLFVYNLRFPGQFFDVETGLHYNYMRDYDPATGRYPQSDPIGLQGGLNTYAYANLNPMSYADPSGLVPGPYTGFDKIPSRAVPSTGAVGVSVRCGLLPAVMGGSSGGVHCEVVATCKKTGETVAFGIGGGGNGIWERLFGGKTPPKYQNPGPALPPSEITQYTASCGDGEGEDCGCKALECFKQMQAQNTPPPYYALRRNSNSYAHFLLNQCGCSLNGDPSGAVAW